MKQETNPKVQNQKKFLKYEDCIEVIEREISKRRSQWQLSSIHWMDFDDVAQILRIHIHNKWDKYDQGKPLGPWLAQVMVNQIINLIKNQYGNYARPCLGCAAAEPDDLCSVYEKQCDKCPIYKKWLKNKKRAYDLKLPLSLEFHSQEVDGMPSQYINFDTAAANLHDKMSHILKKKEWIVYKHLYIDNLKEEDLAILLNFKTTEVGRIAGYKQIKNIKKKIMVKVRKIVKDIDIV